jgi:hypothetical protein
VAHYLHIKCESLIFTNAKWVAQETVFGRRIMSVSTQSRPAGKKMSAQKHSPKWTDSIRYKCHFCRNVLLKVPSDSVWFLFLLLGFRRFYCPHCFEMRIRPCGWLRGLLAPAWILFNVLRGK